MKNLIHEVIKDSENIKHKISRTQMKHSNKYTGVEKEKMPPVMFPNLPKKIIFIF